MVSSRILKTGLVALALSGAALVSSLPAQAGESTGTWRNGMVEGPYGPGYYAPDGTYYGNGHRQRRRAYVQESYRESYRPAPRYRRSYDYYGDPYGRPPGYDWQGNGAYDPYDR
jgi:hypothetical protein